jgi:hypothetical protein
MANQNAAVMGEPQKEDVRAHNEPLHSADGEEYCSAGCLEAGSDDVEIARQCDHGACSLTNPTICDSEC